jgi:hypothetical protein
MMVLEKRTNKERPYLLTLLPVPHVKVAQKLEQKIQSKLPLSQMKVML